MKKFNPYLLNQLDLDTLENVLESFGVTFKEYENILEPTAKKVDVSWPVEDEPGLKFAGVEFHFRNDQPAYITEYSEELEPTTLDEECELEPLAKLISKNPRLIRSLEDYTTINVAWKTVHEYDGINGIYIPQLHENFYYEVVMNGKEYRINVYNGEFFNERIF